MCRTRTLHACLASAEADHQPFRERIGSHQRRGTGFGSYPRRRPPHPFGRKPADSLAHTPLSWHATFGLAVSAFSLLYMAEILLEAFSR